MEFEQLPLTWKILVIMGIIFTLIMIGLIVFVIIVFKTDLIPLDFIIDAKDTNIDEYEDFLSEWEKTKNETNNETVDDLFKDIDINNLLKKKII